MPVGSIKTMKYQTLKRGKTKFEAMCLLGDTYHKIIQKDLQQENID